MYVDEADKGMSFCNYGELLLLGGGGHRTGKQGGCWQELEAFARKHCKNAEIVGKDQKFFPFRLGDFIYLPLYVCKVAAIENGTLWQNNVKYSIIMSYYCRQEDLLCQVRKSARIYA